MRPRVFPAEDATPGLERGQTLNASMRPRVFPAEDVPDPSEQSGGLDRFNEAAGIPRGRRRDCRAFLQNWEALQ